MKKKKTLQLENESKWLSEMKAKSATICYWDLVMQVEVILLILFHAHKEGNFETYLEALEHFIQFFFALDHTYYSRWASVHLKNMRTLPEAIKYEFITTKNWMIRKTNSRLTEVMCSLTSNDLCPITSDDPAYRILKNFTCKLYDRTTDVKDVNILRESMFCRKTQRVECLPPTQDALLLHCNTSLYQAYIWIGLDYEI